MFLANGPRCPQAVPTLWTPRKDDPLSCVFLGAAVRPPERSGVGVGGRSATLTRGCGVPLCRPGMAEAPGTAPGLLPQRASTWAPRPLTFGMGSSLSPEGGGGGTVARRHGTGWGGLAFTRVELPVALQAEQTPGQVASRAARSGTAVVSSSCPLSWLLWPGTF